MGMKLDLSKLLKEMHKATEETIKAKAETEKSTKANIEAAKVYEELKNKITSLDSETKNLQKEKEKEVKTNIELVSSLKKEVELRAITSKSLANLKQQYEELNKSYDQTVKALEKETKANQEKEKSFNKMAKDYKSLSALQGKTLKKMEHMNSGMKRQREAYGKLTIENKKLRTDLKKVSKQYEISSEDIEKLTAKLVKLEGQLKKKKGWRNQREGVVAFNRQLRQFLPFLTTTYLAWKGKELFGNILDIGGNFRQEMVKVQAILGSTTSETNTLEKEIRKLGRSTEWTTNQIADAAKFLGMSGLTVEQTTKALHSVLNLATAGQIDLAKAADISTNAMIAMHLEVKDLTRVNDAFVATSTMSNVSIEEMADTFRYAAPKAAAYGYSIEKLTALMGALGNAGIKGCYDEETEVLTKDGWKKWKDVTEDDELATRNPDTNEIEFQKPIRLIKYFHKGDMYVVKNKHLDIKVTPDHRMWVKGRDKEKFEVKRAHEIEGKSFRYQSGDLKWEGKKDKKYILKGFSQNRGSWVKEVPDLEVDIDLWAYFLGCFLSEGSTNYNKGSYNVIISQFKPKMKEKIWKELQKLPFHIRKDKSGFVIANEQVYKEVKYLGKQPCRFIPQYAKEWSPDILEHLLEGLMDGDGDINNVYYSSSKKLIDDVSEIALKAGYGAKTIKRKEKGSKCIIKGREIVSKHDSLAVSVRKKHLYPWYNQNEYRGKHGEKTKGTKFPHYEGYEYYEGFVYCAEVPNHLLIVRRNGQIVVSGNSLAGTQLSFAIGKVPAIFKALGMKGEGKDLLDALDAINKAGWSTSDVLKKMAERGGRAGVILRDIVPLVRLFQKQIEESTNISNKVADQMRNTYVNDIKVMKSAFSELGISIFDTWNESLRDAAQSITAFITDNKEDIVEFFDHIGKGIKSLTHDFADLAQVLTIGGKLLSSFANAIEDSSFVMSIGAITMAVGAFTLNPTVAGAGIAIMGSTMIFDSAVDTIKKNLDDETKRVILSKILGADIVDPNVQKDMSDFSIEKWDDFINGVSKKTAEGINEIKPSLSIKEAMKKMSLKQWEEFDKAIIEKSIPKYNIPETSMAYDSSAQKILNEKYQKAMQEYKKMINWINVHMKKGDLNEENAIAVVRGKKSWLRALSDSVKANNSEAKAAAKEIATFQSKMSKYSAMIQGGGRIESKLYNFLQHLNIKKRPDFKKFLEKNDIQIPPELMNKFGKNYDKLIGLLTEKENTIERVKNAYKKYKEQINLLQQQIYYKSYKKGVSSINAPEGFKEKVSTEEGKKQLESVLPVSKLKEELKALQESYGNQSDVIKRIEEISNLAINYFKKYLKTEQKKREEVNKLIEKENLVKAQSFIDMSTYGYLTDKWATKQNLVSYQKIFSQKDKFADKDKSFSYKTQLQMIEKYSIKMKEYKSQLTFFAKQAEKDKKKIFDIPEATIALKNYETYFNQLLRLYGASDEEIERANKRFKDSWGKEQKEEVVTVKDSLDKQLEILNYYYDKSGILTKENYELQKKMIDNEYKDNVKKYDKLYALHKREIDMKKLERRNRDSLSLTKDILMGIGDAGDDLSKQYQTTGEIIENSLVGAFNGASDALYDLIAGTKSAGEAFKRMAFNIVSDLTKMIIKQEIYNALLDKRGSSKKGFLSLVGNAFMGLFSNASSSQMIPVNSGYTPSFASGGVVSGISDYSNSIVSTPTFVPTASPYKEFASGGALFGEKGAEAILPLQRDSSGKLGVKGTAPNVQVKIINNTSEKTESTINKPKWDGEKWVIGVVLDAMKRNKGGFRTNFKSVMK